MNIFIADAAGNFLVPLSAMSFNAYKTVIEIDTIGTFNCSKACFDKYMKVPSNAIIPRRCNYFNTAIFQHYGGVIINISANLHYKASLLQAHAGSAKAAIGRMTTITEFYINAVTCF